MSKNAWKRERIEIEGLIPAKWYPRSFLLKRLSTLLEYYEGVEAQMTNAIERLAFVEAQNDSLKLALSAHEVRELEAEDEDELDAEEQEFLRDLEEYYNMER